MAREVSSAARRRLKKIFSDERREPTYKIPDGIPTGFDRVSTDPKANQLMTPSLQKVDYLMRSRIWMVV